MSQSIAISDTASLISILVGGAHYYAQSRITGKDARYFRMRLSYAEEAARKGNAKQVVGALNAIRALLPTEEREGYDKHLDAVVWGYNNPRPRPVSLPLWANLTDAEMAVCGAML